MNVGRRGTTSGRNLGGFFDEAGPEASAGIEAVSMDMSAGYAKSVTQVGHAPGPSSATTPFT
jgi:hypothetical protein